MAKLFSVTKKTREEPAAAPARRLSDGADAVTFCIEWWLALHRAVWFPVNWALGLESPGIEIPVEFAPGFAAAPPVAKLRVIKGGRIGAA